MYLYDKLGSREEHGNVLSQLENSFFFDWLKVEDGKQSFSRLAVFCWQGKPNNKIEVVKTRNFRC